MKMKNESIDIFKGETKIFQDVQAEAIKWNSQGLDMGSSIIDVKRVSWIKVNQK